jgi:hypothetical protein
MRERHAELLLGHDAVDDAPAFHRAGVVSAAEHRHLLRPRRTGALRDPLDPAHQRVQPDRRLHRPQF